MLLIRLLLQFESALLPYKTLHHFSCTFELFVHDINIPSEILRRVSFEDTERLPNGGLRFFQRLVLNNLSYTFLFCSGSMPF